MFPSWLRFLIAVLLTLLVINLFLTLPKVVKNSESKFPVAVLSPKESYTCEVDRVEGCTLYCYEIETATLLRLRPEDCNSLKGLKRGQKIRFEVENLSYHNDGSIPVRILPLGGRG